MHALTLRTARILALLLIAASLTACRTSALNEANRQEELAKTVEVLPDVPFNEAEAARAMQPGNGRIVGTVYAQQDRANGPAERIFKSNRRVLLIPRTAHLDSYLSTQRNRRITQRMPVIGAFTRRPPNERLVVDNRVFQYARETTTDAYGRFVFDRVQPGEWVLETEFEHTFYTRQRYVRAHWVNPNNTIRQPIYEWGTYTEPVKTTLLEEISVKPAPDVREVEMYHRNTRFGANDQPGPP